MMSMVPMEALAIDYLTHTVLNVWTWLAFLTAALSFWKIKSSIHSPPHHHSLKLSSPPVQPHATSAEPDPDDQQDRILAPATPLFTPSTAFCSLENRRSGKFRVYYGEVDNEDDGMFIGRSERRMMGSVRRVSVRVDDGWEALLKMKTAEMGWYRYQDLTVLDGSVVRLWKHGVLLGNC
ncbi:hypothetical protein E3N88_06138 [Mikania micrantha]|uniref:Uncharacterized protein n=1 Tax=Mikania micrantha TaxID=192012 RepID=A0A5N6PNS2_9ASTR|nr:hypothetical protein E3N88_06138 [Mikania micrantha]